MVRREDHHAGEWSRAGLRAAPPHLSTALFSLIPGQSEEPDAVLCLRPTFQRQPLCDGQLLQGGHLPVLAGGGALVNTHLKDSHVTTSVCEWTWRPADGALCPQEAAMQRGMSQWLGDREELLKQLLDWALGGFQPGHPHIVPPAVTGESPVVWI